MNNYQLSIKCSILLACSLMVFSCKPTISENSAGNGLTQLNDSLLTYQLPSAKLTGNISVEEALANRRSHRYFQDKEISAEALSQVLWSAYGITMPRDDYEFLRGGLRTAPSAGGLYPLEVYVLAGKVKGIEPGVYKYEPKGNKIVRIIDADEREKMSKAALNQDMIKEAPAVLFYSAIFSRSTEKYGTRARERYVCMDLGHSAENVYLQVEALNMGTCAVGAFNDEEVRKIMRLPEEEEPLYMMPFGYYFDKKEF